MQVQEVIGRAVAHMLEHGDDIALMVLGETLIYHHAFALEEDIPLERVESDLIEYFEGDLPEVLDKWIDSLDDEWNPDTAEHIIQDL